jgi:ABC-type hemin transport system substrate-binding protein
MMDARTVAMIARAVSEDEATALIEQYARTFAAHAAFKATEQTCDKILLALARAANAPLVRT